MADVLEGRHDSAIPQSFVVRVCKPDTDEVLVYAICQTVTTVDGQEGLFDSIEFVHAAGALPQPPPGFGVGPPGEGGPHGSGSSIQVGKTVNINFNQN